MSKIKLNKYQMIAFFTAILMVTTACSFSVFQDPTATAVPPVTMVVTQVITQVIPATIEPEVTNTPAVSPTPSPTLIPTLAGTYDPYSAPLWYPIKIVRPPDCILVIEHMLRSVEVPMGSGLERMSVMILLLVMLKKVKE